MSEENLSYGELEEMGMRYKEKPEILRVIVEAMDRRRMVLYFSRAMKKDPMKQKAKKQYRDGDLYEGDNEPAA